MSTTGSHARHAHATDAAQGAQTPWVQEPEPAASALTQPAPPQHGGSCSMLTRCDWVAVPTEPTGSAPTLHFGSAAGTAFTDVPAAGEHFSSTPPPRPIS